MERNFSVVLENGEEYIKLNSVMYNNIEYMLLSNISNIKDVCVRKVVKENGKEYVCRLEKKELEEVLKLLNTKEENS